MAHRRLRRALVAFALGACSCCAIAQAAPEPAEEVLQVWPGDAPGSEVWTGPELSEEAPHPTGKIQLKRNVSAPTLTVFRPAAGKGNGTAMLVLPGGAFGALAWDLEGTEVAHWLADRGITAFLLKYRVRSWPIPPGVKIEKPADYIPILEQGRKIAVADASEAVRLVRRKAALYEIEPDRIGMIGFSAGAVTILGVVLESDASALPDFIAPIYGFTMIDSPVLPAEAPPLFVVAAQDDGLVTAEHNQQIYNLWNHAKRPVEMHLFEEGGHGFGMRPQNKPVDAWPTIFEAWLRSQGLIQ
jgi:acetyl esterase/lipase